MRIAVAGGTGLVGRFIVDEVRAAGHQPVVIARSAGVDILTGAGLARALDGAQAVIDVSNTPAMRRSAATAFFVAGARNLLAAGQQAGVAHHVLLSIVGIDRLRMGYYAAKLDQEALVRDSGVPASIMRATQFHEFVPEFLARIPGPVVAMPRLRVQPVAAAEVARALVAVATGGPVGSAPDMAGPEQLELAGLARRVLRARGSSRVVLSFRLPGAAGRAMADGALLASGPGLRGQQTFSEWLAGQQAAAVSLT